MSENNYPSDSRSNFEKMIEDSDATIAPKRYVEKAVVYYNDNTSRRVLHVDLPDNICVINYYTWLPRKYKNKKITDLKIYLDTEKLEFDINHQIHEIVKRVFT